MYLSNEACTRFLKAAGSAASRSSVPRISSSTAASLPRASASVPWALAAAPDASVTVSGIAIGAWKLPATLNPGRDVPVGSQRLPAAKPYRSSSMSSTSRTLPIISRAPAAERVDLENLGSIQIWSPAAGKMVPIDQVVNGFSTEFEDANLWRRNRTPMLKIHADPRSILPSELMARVKAVLRRSIQAKELSRDESILFMAGDAINDEVLVEAGVERAYGLISGLPDDEANAVAVLVIHEAQMIPTPGQVFSFHGFRFDIIRRQRNQIMLVKMKPMEEPGVTPPSPRC